jgi:transposase-like protein
MMDFMTEPPLNPALMVCPHCEEADRIWIHSQKERRFKCASCDRTFAESRGTPLFNKRYPKWVVILVLSLLAGGCPVQAIVFAFKINEQTVAAWQLAAGEHAQQVQEQKVCSGQLQGEQIQSDEMWVKTQFGAMWMATGMAVFSRLFIWGAVSIERNTNLMEQVVIKIKQAVKRGMPFLWVTDGFGGWEQAIRKQLRTPLYTGKPGRPRLYLWPELQMVQVVKRQSRRCLLGIERRLRIGRWSVALQILCQTQTDLGVFNTAYVERLNATLRTWIPALTRRTRTPSRYRPQLEAALFWTGAVYNFCRIHATLEATPAMAAGLTEEVWTVRELLFCLQKRPKSIHATL